jgi:hypothetical protein
MDPKDNNRHYQGQGGEIKTLKLFSTVNRSDWFSTTPTIPRARASPVSEECRLKARGIVFQKPVCFFLTLCNARRNIGKQSEKAKPSVRVGRKALGL